ncbi:33779_t:CDS:2, partial [Gigaspora margarita]
AAANWYKEVRSRISCWKTESKDEVERNKSFYHLLVKQFMPPEKQHHWQIKLNYLTQQAHKRVDTKNVFGGLKGINTALVAIVVSKSLSEAIAAARK